MDEITIAYYRKLIQNGFKYSGMIEKPSISIENFGEVSPVCGNPDDYMRLFVDVKCDEINDIKYVCISDPATNVALEILCTLLKGKNLNKVNDLNENTFAEFIGSEDKGLKKKAKELLVLLNDGVAKYKAQKK